MQQNHEILLSTGTRFVTTCEIPALIANALHPEVEGPRTIKQISKVAKPGASRETDKRDGWPIDDDDDDLSDLEATLTAQAATLDAMFNELARRAALNMGTHLPATEAYLRQAFKAQAQCRSTLEALAEIKNPRPVAFVKQANISHGPQQVNNGVRAGESHTHGNNPIQSNELSGGGNELLQDTRTQAVACGVNREVETVGAIYRAKD